MKNLIRILPVFLFLCTAILSGCEKKEAEGKTEDKLPPQVMIVQPYDQAIVTDTVMVRVLATDESGVKKVLLYLDGLPVEGVEDFTEPYDLPWNTLVCSDSSTHILTARAEDFSGNKTDSDPITCQVDHSHQYPDPVEIVGILYEEEAFSISWNRFQGFHFARYTLYESSDSIFNVSIEIYSTEDIQDTFFVVHGISPGETRYYQLKITNNLMFSALSEIMEGYAIPPIPQGLVAHYPFNGNADDESGYEHHGVVMDAMLTEDRFGNPASAFEFGEDRYIEIPDHEDMVFPNGFTLAAWVFPSDMMPHANIISRVNPNRDFVMQLDMGNLLNAHYDPAESPMCHIFSDDPLHLNKWSHVACVYQASSLKIFVHGTLMKTKSFGSAVPPWTGKVMLIGAMNYGEFFYGKLDDVMVFNRPLSDEEIGYLDR
jgi:hypothetical protein